MKELVCKFFKTALNEREKVNILIRYIFLEDVSAKVP